MTTVSAPTESVTLVTQTRILPGRSDDFAKWQQRIGEAVARAEGFLDQSLLPPMPPAQLDWVIIQRFVSADAARAWLQSQERAALLHDVQPLLVGPVDIHLFSGDGPRPAASPVSVVIATKVKPGQEATFRLWQQKVEAIESKFPGFQGYKLEPPVAGVQDDWVTVLRFDSDDHLDAWLNSAERRQLLVESAEFDAETHYRKVRNGFDSWFANQGGAAPPGWKMNMIVLLALYPFVFLFGKWVGTPFLSDRGVPFWLTLFISNIASTVALGSLIVPWMSRALGWWLNPPAARRERVNIEGIALIGALYGVCLLVFSQYS